MNTMPRIFTWHVHGSYLAYLAHARAQFYVPTRPGRPEGYGGRSGSIPWPPNVIEVPAEAVPSLDLDCVLYQSRRNWQFDQYEILGDAQRRLPRIYLEHDPPRQDPTGTQHPVDDPDVLLVHVTAFNDLMWDSGLTPTCVIEHGVVDRGWRYTGELPRGIAVVNNLAARGRRLGADVFARAATAVPIDLVGMGAEAAGGIGEVEHGDLPAFMGQYRFFFNPIRYTSLGLAVCEAMMAGLPVVALATTEMATVIRNGQSGFVDTSVDALVDVMRGLIADPTEALHLGEGARRTAVERFDIRRFAHEWERTFALVTGGTERHFAGATAGGVA